MNGTVRISVNDFVEIIAMRANMRSLERYVNKEEYSIDRETIAAICGFKLKEVKKDA